MKSLDKPKPEKGEKEKALAFRGPALLTRANTVCKQTLRIK